MSAVTIRDMERKDLLIDMWKRYFTKLLSALDECDPGSAAFTDFCLRIEAIIGEVEGGNFGDDVKVALIRDDRLQPQVRQEPPKPAESAPEPALKPAASVQDAKPSPQSVTKAPKVPPERVDPERALAPVHALDDGLVPCTFNNRRGVPQDPAHVDCWVTPSGEHGKLAHKGTRGRLVGYGARALRAR